MLKLLFTLLDRNLILVGKTGHSNGATQFIPTHTSQLSLTLRNIVNIWSPYALCCVILAVVKLFSSSS